MPCAPQDSLNGFMALGKDAWREARSTLTRLLSASEGLLRDDAALRQQLLVPQVGSCAAKPCTCTCACTARAPSELATVQACAALRGMLLQRCRHAHTCLPPAQQETACL